MSDKKILLGAKEICEIINQCGLSNVRSLSFEGLKLTFGSNPKPPTIEVPTEAPGQLNPGEITATVSQTREAQIEEQASNAERELDQLLINDPEEFERLIRLGELENERA